MSVPWRMLVVHVHPDDETLWARGDARWAAGPVREPSRMSLIARITLGVLVFDAVALAVVELLYLPLRVGTVPLPITIGLAAVSTPWLISSAAQLRGPRLVAAIPLVAWVLALGVFGVGGPGGDVLLPADWRSALLLGGGMFPAAVVLGRVYARS